MDVFEFVYDALHDEGMCDSVGSAEFDRVREDWIAFGEVAALISFIVAVANSSEAYPQGRKTPEVEKRIQGIANQLCREVRRARHRLEG